MIVYGLSSLIHESAEFHEFFHVILRYAYFKEETHQPYFSECSTEGA